MAENTEEPSGGEEPTFAELFESYTPEMVQDLQVGDQITAKVIAIGADSVFVDAGSKVDGVVSREELLDDDGQLACSVGDPLDLYVVGVDDSEIRLSKALSGAGNAALLEEAHAKAVPVEGRVSATCKGGFRVDVMGQSAFCPISQMDITYVETPEDYVGQTFAFLIVRFEENGRNIVLSRRSLIEKEQKEAQRAFLETLHVGDVVEGTVRRLMPYGAFVELAPGLEGMLHISEMSWSRVVEPRDVLTVGETLTVKVTDVEKAADGKRVRIALSAKALSGDPWEQVSARLHEGDKVKGVVTRLAKFGAFVELLPGVEGLVHLSEMSYARRIHRAEEVVHPGQAVYVMIKSIDVQKRRVSLSIKDAEGDPWRDAPEKYSAGKVVMGSVEKKERFGLFVKLEPGVTGLMPKSKFDRFEDPAQAQKLKAGDRIAVTVEEIRPAERKLVLSPAASQDAGDWQPFAGDSAANVSDLGEKLRRALSHKK